MPLSPMAVLRQALLGLVLILPAVVPAHAQTAGDISYRLSTLEEQIRQLNGQVETLNHRVRQLEAQLGATGAGSSATYNSGAGNGTPMDFGGDHLGETGGQQLGAPPQILGQLPAGGQGLDLSGALGGNPSGVQQDLNGNISILEGGQGLSANPGESQQALLTPGGEPQDDYDVAYSYILRGEFPQAQQAFQAFLERHPQHELAGNAQYWLGEAFFARGAFREAADAFLSGYTDYPESSKAPDSLYKLGMSLKELGQTEAACATFSEISRTFPNAPQTVVDRTRAEMEKSGCS